MLSITVRTLFKTQSYILLKDKNKAFKTCMNKSCKKYPHNFRDKLRKCKSSNPKTCWSLLNNGKNNQCQVNINDEFKHFEKC